MMRSTTLQSISLALLTSVFVFVSSSANGADKPRVSFDAAGVVAGVTPGASTVWFAVSHERELYDLRIVDRSGVRSDADRDGIVRIDLSQPSGMAVFLVADLATGEYDIAMPPGFSPRRRPLHPKSVQHRAEAGRAQVSVKGAYVTVWVARPGIGAWTATITDGTARDGDGSPNGQVTAFLDAMQPIGASPLPPVEFQSDDIVAAVDVLRLRMSDLRVAR